MKSGKYLNPLNPYTGEVSALAILKNLENGHDTFPEHMGDTIKDEKSLANRMNLPIKPGRLIRFRCLSGGIVINYWEAIYHGGNVVHTVGKRRTGGTWLLSESQPEDKLTPIRHGVLVERDWDAYVIRRGEEANRLRAWMEADFAKYLAFRAFDPCI